MKEPNSGKSSRSSGPKKTTRSASRTKKTAQAVGSTYFVAGQEAMELNPGQTELLQRLAREHGAPMVKDDVLLRLDSDSDTLAAWVAYKLEDLRGNQTRLQALFEGEAAS